MLFLEGWSLSLELGSNLKRNFFFILFTEKEAESWSDAHSVKNPQHWYFMKLGIFQFVTLGCEMAMVFGGVMPYIPQYIQIKQKQTTQVGKQYQ